MSTLKGPLVSLKVTVAHMSHMKTFTLFFCDDSGFYRNCFIGVWDRD